jgi:preprotein translocase subunit SecB
LEKLNEGVLTMSENMTQPIDQPEVRTIGIYLRNVSLETCRSPALLRRDIKQEFKLELKVQADSLEESDEVMLDMIITVRDKSDLLYLFKIQQVGCFTLKHFTTEQKQLFLNTVCPTMLYPYASQMANTLVVQAGYPALHLTPIDFTHLYRQQQQATQIKTDNRQEVTQTTTQGNQKKWTSVMESVDSDAHTTPETVV